MGLSARETRTWSAQLVCPFSASQLSPVAVATTCAWGVSRGWKTVPAVPGKFDSHLSSPPACFHYIVFGSAWKYTLSLCNVRRSVSWSTVKSATTKLVGRYYHRASFTSATTLVVNCAFTVRGGDCSLCTTVQQHIVYISIYHYYYRFKKYLCIITYIIFIIMNYFYIIIMNYFYFIIFIIYIYH